MIFHGVLIFELKITDSRLSEVQGSLFRSAPLDKDPITRNLSLHRLVQAAVLNDLNAEDKMRYIQDSIELMIKVFPAAWADGSDGFTYSKWDACRRCLPYVVHLSNYLCSQPLGENVIGPFISLLLRCSWYIHSILV